MKFERSSVIAPAIKPQGAPLGATEGYWLDDEAIRTQVHREFHCEHAQTQFTFREGPTGKKTYYLQCIRCGQNLKQLGKDYVYRREIPVPHNDRLALEWWQRLREREAQLRGEAWKWMQEQKWNDRRQEYNDYLESPAWKHRHNLVMKRAGHLCEACGERPAVHVHHLTYAHFGNEFLWELRAVCPHCHQRIHDLGPFTDDMNTWPYGR